MAVGVGAGQRGRPSPPSHPGQRRDSTTAAGTAASPGGGRLPEKPAGEEQGFLREPQGGLAGKRDRRSLRGDGEGELQPLGQTLSTNSQITTFIDTFWAWWEKSSKHSVWVISKSEAGHRHGGPPAQFALSFYRETGRGFIVIRVILEFFPDI